MDKSSFTPVPTPMTLFMRRFPLWQLFRFIVINIKMMKMIRKCHHPE